MMFRRVASYAICGALLVVAASFGLYPWRSAVTVDFATDTPPRVVTGVYPSERTPDGLTFVWTRGAFGLELPGLDRTTAWTVTLRLAAARADGTSPQFTASVDGVVKKQVALPAVGFTDQVLTIPPRTDGARGASAGFEVTPTFVPGPGDTRKLGAQIDSVRIEPASRMTRLGSSLVPLIACGFLAGAIFGMVAVPRWWSLGLLTAVSILTGLVVTRGLAPFVTIAWAPALVTASAVSLLAWAALPRGSNSARVVVALTFVVVLIKLLVLFHPDMPVGDTMFHAHRFQDVLGGKYVFTSIAPGNYRFPYPIGLYVTAWPFARLTGAGFDNMALLRCVVVAADAFAAAMLFRFALTWRRDETAGLSAVGIYHLLPLSFGVIATANLTNEFAQSIAMLVLAGIACLTDKLGREEDGRLAPLAVGNIVTVIIIALLSCAAFLSHTSTFAVLGTQLVLTGLAFAFSRHADRRRTGRLLLAAAMAALVLAVGLYYSRFMDVYRESFTRISAETGHATAAAGGRTPMTRLFEVPRGLWICFGLPALLMAGMGAIAIVRRRQAHTEGQPGLSVILGAWLLACLGFLVVGVITPVDLRHFLAALPLVSLLAAAGFSSLVRANRWGKAFGLGLMLGIVWLGAVSWLGALAS